MNKELLEFRNEKRKKLPSFSRQDSHKKVKVGKRWRKPRGWQNKIRLQLKGYRKKVKAGYGTPVEFRGTTSKGLIPVRIIRVRELKDLDPKKNIIILASNVGAKNKLKIIEEAKKLGLGFLNFNPEKYMAKLAAEKVLKAAKKKKKAEKEKKKAKKEDKEKKKPLEDAVKSEEAEITDEEKKKQAKEDKDKLLTKAK